MLAAPQLIHRGFCAGPQHHGLIKQGDVLRQRTAQLYEVTGPAAVLLSEAA